MMFCLIDCNNFYVSCERLFNPHLKNKACAVLSNNDGCIIARSNEAKALNIKMGDPIFLYKNLINEKKLEVYSSNFVLYGDLSNRVMETIKSFELEMEIYSIDEAFLIVNLPQNKLLDFAIFAQQKIYRWTGISVSIGIAPTKTLAKIANETAKKRGGILILDSNHKIDEILAQTKIEDVWSIGVTSSQILKKINIINAKQLKEADDNLIKKHLKTLGIRTLLELRSIPCYNLEKNPKPKKSIHCSRSFPNEVLSFEKLKNAIANFTFTAAKKLRKQNSVASHLTIFLATNRFKKEKYYSNSFTIGLSVGSDYTPELLSKADIALKKIYIDGLFYKKAGIMLSSISEKKYIQQDFFTASISLDKKSRAMKALDNINRHFHRQALFFASQGLDKKWMINQSRKSQKFTTSWDELLKISI